jgi:DNA-directed RNA polymerase subunit RPC12/RpoP
MFTKTEVREVKKWNIEERKQEGKRPKPVFKGGSTGDIKPGICSECGKKYEKSKYSYESGYYNCCEECSLRMLPELLRGKHDKDIRNEKPKETKPEVDQKTQLKPTALEVINYKAGTQGFPQHVEAFEEQKGEGKKRLHKGGRPKKYHSPSERKKAKAESQRKRAKEARSKK